MPFNKFSFIKVGFILLALCFSTMAVAETGGGESSSGGSSEDGEPRPHPDSKEWLKRTQKLKGIEARVKEQNKALQILIEGKNNGQKFVKDDKDNVDILEIIVRTHRDLVESHAEYKAERTELKYRFPGGSGLLERRYLPLRAPSLNQLEREMGLDGELNVLRKKIDKKYAKFIKMPTEHPDRDDGPGSVLKNTKKKKKRKKLKLVK